MRLSGLRINDISTVAPQRVVVHWRRRDLLRAMWQIALRSRFWFLVFAACLTITLYPLLRGEPSSADAFLVVAAVLTAVLFTGLAVILNYLILLPCMLFRLGRTPGVLGEHLFEVGEEGLREVTDVSEIRMSPGSASRLIRTRSYLIAMLPPRAVFLLPRRDFADAAAYDGFWKALQPLVAAKKT